MAADEVVDPLFRLPPGRSEPLARVVLHCSASSLLALSNTSRGLSECVAAEFKHWLRSAPAMQSGVTRMLGFVAGMGPNGNQRGDAEWAAFRVLYDRYAPDNLLGNDAQERFDQGAGRWTPREIDPRQFPLAPWLTAPLWPVVRARLALHAWAMLYWFLRTENTDPPIWPAGSSRETAFLDLLDRTWEIVWRFPGPLPTQQTLKDPSTLPLNRRERQLHGSSEIHQQSLDAFPTPRSVAGKSVYPRMILQCMKHNLARPLHILLSTFGIPELGYENEKADQLFLGTGIEGITSLTSGTYWRYSSYTIREPQEAAETIAFRFGGRKVEHQELEPAVAGGGPDLGLGQAPWFADGDDNDNR